MRNYYLFKLINSNLNSKKVYLVLEELFYLNKNKFKYGLSIFKSICLPINKKNMLKLNNSKIQINNCFLLIRSDNNIPDIFKDINAIENNMFVCDFESRDYFYLNSFVKLNLKILT